MYDLSVCLAAIRKHNWKRLYDSIVASIGDYKFELIFCGPHKELPDELKGVENVSCVQDFGSPTRAQQISMKNATGRYITWTADDGWFYPEALEACIEYLDSTPGRNKKNCIVTQYVEGGSDGLGEAEDGMYFINSHAPVRTCYCPDDYLIFNSVIMNTEYFHELGGFDAKFEACPMAFVDFGMRAQQDGASPVLFSAIFECTHSPGHEGDHGPIHDAQIRSDEHLYKQIWRRKKSLSRKKIDFDNWKKSPPLWDRRFTLSNDSPYADASCLIDKTVAQTYEIPDYLMPHVKKEKK